LDFLFLIWASWCFQVLVLSSTQTMIQRRQTHTHPSSHPSSFRVLWSLVLSAFCLVSLVVTRRKKWDVLIPSCQEPEPQF
jgi:hypothetical protein